MRANSGLLGIAAFGAGLATYSLIRNASARLALRGKVVLITGGSRGLGLELARQFGSEGCRVVIGARNARELERALVDLEQRGIEAHAMPCDISNRLEAEALVTETVRRFGSIDILVNNAGIIQVGPIDQMTIGDFEDAMAVMFWGALYTTMAALPHMRARRSGRIVNITSIGGKVSVPHLVPYSCAKFAAVALSEGLRSELAPYGVKVVTIVPGLMRMGSYLNAQFKGDHAKEFAWFSMGSASPLTSIGAGRAARSIVRSTAAGSSENILSVPANLLARLHGLVPEMTLPIFSLVNRLVLPGSPARQTELQSGHRAKQQLNSRILESINALGEKAARELNELPATL